MDMDNVDLNSVNEISGLWTYLKSIDWTDPWLIAVILSHICVTLTTILTRRYASFQALLFLALLLLVFFSEQINEIAARNWRSFSRQQYFDSQGMFISFIFSIPLLLDCIIMVCNWLWTSGTLMVQIKRAQLKRRIKEQKSLAGANEPGSPPCSKHSRERLSSGESSVNCRQRAASTNQETTSARSRQSTCSKNGCSKERKNSE